MDLRYNLSELFRAAFGINSPIFITEPLSKKAANAFDYKGIGLIKDYYKKEATSWMGTPIIGQLTFKGGSYKIYDGSGNIENIEYQDYILPAATLFSFRRAKNITRTNILGNNGTVKEVFGFDDWVIDVKGLAVDTPTMSAGDQLSALKEWEELASAINVTGKLFGAKKISSVVIEDYKEESVQGSPGIIPFSMTLISDEPLEIGGLEPMQKY